MILRHLLALTLISSALRAQITPQPARPSVFDARHWTYVREDDPAQPPQPGVSHHRLRSDKMEREVGFNVLLPPGYEEQPQQRFPVIYFLHGGRGDERSFRLTPLISKLMKEKQIAPAIWVFPNGGHGSMWRDRAEGNEFKVYVDTFITKELIPHIDATWRTLAKREHRVVCGYSMGGYGSVRFAFKYPELFSACLSLAGSFFEPMNEDELKQQPADDFPSLLLKTNHARIQAGVAVRLVIGTEDPRLLEGQRFSLLLKQEGVRFEAHYPDAVKHLDLDRLFTEKEVRWVHQHACPAAQRPRAWDAQHWYYVSPKEPAHSASPGVTHHIIHSAKMDRDVGFNILVPPGYETSALRYPVIYNLHGATGNEHCKGFAPKVMRLMKEGKVPPAIWVFPNGAQGSMWRDGPPGNKFATYVDTFVIQELIQHIDSHWRTLAQRGGRAVTGFSMGGYGSVRFAFKYPELFCACLSISGGAFEPKDEAELAAKPADDFPSLLLKQNFTQLHGKLPLKLIAGTQDFNFKPVKRFAELLQREGFAFEQEYPEGLTHQHLDRYFSDEVIAWLHAKVLPAAK